MPGWLKVLLIVALVLVLLVGGVIGAGIFWWVRNKDAVVGRLKEVATEGKNFGRHSDNKGCLDETMSRYKREPGFTNAISDSIFMRTCLDASKPTAGFCDGVPGRTEFMKTGGGLNNVITTIFAMTNTANSFFSRCRTTAARNERAAPSDGDIAGPARASGACEFTGGLSPLPLGEGWVSLAD